MTEQIEPNINPDGITPGEKQLRGIKSEILSIQDDLIETYDTGPRYDGMIRQLDQLDKEGTVVSFLINKKPKEK